MATGQRGTRSRDIISAAARVLAAGEAAGMRDIAAAAGIARGTLYRYFPSRESLLRALEAAANEEARLRLAEANLDQVPVDEGLARATRALAALLERGREGGQIRADIPLAILVESLLVLIGVCVRTGSALGMGSEDVSSTALRLFLAGARPADE